MTVTVLGLLNAAPASAEIPGGLDCVAADGKVSGRGSTSQNRLQALFGESYSQTFCGMNVGEQYAGDPAGTGMVAYNYPEAESHGGTGSGNGIKAASCRTDDFAASDIPYTNAELREVLDEAPGKSGGCAITFEPPFQPKPGPWPNPEDHQAKTMSFPVGGYSVAIAVHLSASECGGSAPSALSFSARELSRVLGGDALAWNDAELVATNPALGACSVPIRRVVRKDNAETTGILKQYLVRADNERVGATCAPEHHWEQYVPPPNTGWPKPSEGGSCSELVVPEKSGDSELIKKLKETAGGVGYADTADAIGQALLLATVRNATGTTFQPPNVGKADNCSFGVLTLPGATAEEAVGLNLEDNWSNNNDKPKAEGGNEKPNHENATDIGGKYPICGLAFDLVYTGFAGLETPIARLSADQWRTLYSYFTFILSSAGQDQLGEHYYAQLPAVWLRTLREWFQRALVALLEAVTQEAGLSAKEERTKGLAEGFDQATMKATPFNASPPDPTGAIGPNNYVEAVNSTFAVYNRLGLVLSNAPAGTKNPEEMAKLMTNRSELEWEKEEKETTDPQIKWDPWSQRWFYAAILIAHNSAAAEPHKLLWGFSTTSSPLPLTSAKAGEEGAPKVGWCRYEEPTEHFEDQPKLGLDKKHIVIGTNSYKSPEEAEFLTARVFMTNKPTGPKGGQAEAIATCPNLPNPGIGPNHKLPVEGTEANPLRTMQPPIFIKPEEQHLAFAPNPATVAGTSASGFVVAADAFGANGARLPKGTANGIMVWEVAERAGAGEAGLELKRVSEPELVPPEAGLAAAESFDAAPLVPQEAPGETIGLEGPGGIRLTAAVNAPDPTKLGAGREAIWTAHTVAKAEGGNERSAVRWYELAVPNAKKENKAEILQTGVLAPAALWAFNPGIAPTLNGGAAIDYNTGSATKNVAIETQSRTPATARNAMENAATLRVSGALDRDHTCPECRWGDFAGASVDPVNPNLVWGSNEFNGPLEAALSVWETRNFKLRP